MVDRSRSPACFRRAALGCAACAGVLVWATATPAQVLIVSPDCGVAGTTVVQITGSGWAEPPPPCEYIFYLDGVEVAPRQADGLYGPPNASFTIPGVTAPGDHIVKVELRITETQQLRQCRQTKLCVVAALRDPWQNGLRVDPDGRRMRVNFDPTDVCDITPCTEIRLVQTVLNRGYRSDSTNRVLSRGEVKYPNAANLDSAATATGWGVDYIHGERDPYYNGNDAADGGQAGRKECGRDRAATMSDRPNIPDGSFPAGIVRICLEFEVNAFCAAGDDRGTWLGRCTWTYCRVKGGAHTVTPGTCDRSAPSAAATGALNRWNAQHGFTVPAARPPARGGEPCR